MSALYNFLFAFGFSVAGSIPPGTINLTVIQLGMEKRTKIALRFALVASLVEYPYAWIAIKFQGMFLTSPLVTENLKLITAIVLIGLGLINVWPSRKPAFKRFSNSGYRRGLILGILNPLAIPYWLGVTAYLQSRKWIILSSTAELHFYLLGVVTGAFAMLLTLAFLSKKVIYGFDRFPWLKQAPGFLLLALGIYSLFEYFLMR